MLVLALRAWCARSELPSWYRALTDPAIGDALRLLHEDPARRWTVAAVAREVGYADAFAFSVAFKRARDVSPSAWRRQALNGR